VPREITLVNQVTVSKKGQAEEKKKLGRGGKGFRRLRGKKTWGSNSRGNYPGEGKGTNGRGKPQKGGPEAKRCPSKKSAECLKEGFQVSSYKGV